MTKPEVIKAIEKRMKENSNKASKSERGIEVVAYANRNMDLDFALNLVKQLK